MAKKPPSRMELPWTWAEPQFQALDAFWNDNHRLAWGLILVAITLALWASFEPQSPGVSIGLLALAAGIMSVRPKMHPAEKFAWVAVLVTFTILNVLAIKRSDQEQKALWQKTNEAADAAEEGVLGITGADSYLTLILSPTLGPNGLIDGKFTLVAWTVGKHIVWDPTIAQMSPSGYVTSATGIKPVPPGQPLVWGQTIDGSKEKELEYRYTITCRGGEEAEILDIRFNSEKQRWEYRYFVWLLKPFSEGQPKSLGNPVKSVDWGPISSILKVIFGEPMPQ